MRAASALPRYSGSSSVPVSSARRHELLEEQRVSARALGDRLELVVEQAVGTGCDGELERVGLR